MPIGDSGEFPVILVHFKLTGDVSDEKFVIENLIFKSNEGAQYLSSHSYVEDLQ